MDVRDVNYASSPLAAEVFWRYMNPECWEIAVRCLPWSLVKGLSYPLRPAAGAALLTHFSKWLKWAGNQEPTLGKTWPSWSILANPGLWSPVGTFVRTQGRGRAPSLSWGVCMQRSKQTGHSHVCGQVDRMKQGCKDQVSALHQHQHLGASWGWGCLAGGWSCPARQEHPAHALRCTGWVGFTQRESRSYAQKHSGLCSKAQHHLIRD